MVQKGTFIMTCLIICSAWNKKDDLLWRTSHFNAAFLGFKRISWAKRGRQCR